MSEHARRAGAGPSPAPVPTSTRLPRSGTDRLLDGGHGPEPLQQLLAAATASAQPDELGGEQAARRAFSMAAGFAPFPGVVVPQHPRRRTRALSWIVAAKAIAAVALTVGAGGVAMAANSGALPGTEPDVSTRREPDPDPDAARPTIVVDRARDTTERPDADPAPAPEPSPAPPDPRRDGTDPARSDQPGPGEAEAAPDSPPPTAGPPGQVKKSTAKAPPGQQKKEKEKKENQGRKTAGTKQDSPGKSDHVDDPRSEKATQQQERAGQE